jgi:hypothetical protein
VIDVAQSKTVTCARLHQSFLRTELVLLHAAEFAAMLTPGAGVDDVTTRTVAALVLLTTAEIEAGNAAKRAVGLEGAIRVTAFASIAFLAGLELPVTAYCRLTRASA